MKVLKTTLFNRKGNGMVEASIVMPIAILAVLLMIRLFVFYIEILDSGVKEHENAIEAMSAYERRLPQKYESERIVTFAKGGLLKASFSKIIETELFFYNEDEIVRAGELL
jgi:hypothetical protein